jgi:hypothetical protein
MLSRVFFGFTCANCPIGPLMNCSSGGGNVNVYVDQVDSAGIRCSWPGGTSCGVGYLCYTAYMTVPYKCVGDTQWQTTLVEPCCLSIY